MKRWLVLALLLVPTLVIAQDKSATDLKVEKAVVYGKGGDKNLELNIAVPPGKGPFPAVILIHGGSWKSGSYKDQIMTMLLEKIAKAGYVTTSIQYRLTPSGARFPCQIEDCKCAVRWMRGNAEKYQIDPKRIGALGGSAGAHLALLLGLTNKDDGFDGCGDLKPEFAKEPSDVQAVVNLFGPVDLLIGNWEKSTTPVLVDLLGGTIKEKTDLAKKASPINYIEKNRAIPPIITFHGTKDTLVPYIHATKLQSALEKLNAHAKLVTMEGEGHGWFGEKLDKTLQQTIEFFDENLKGKK